MITLHKALRSKVANSVNIAKLICEESSVASLVLGVGSELSCWLGGGDRAASVGQTARIGRHNGSRASGVGGSIVHLKNSDGGGVGHDRIDDVAAIVIAGAYSNGINIGGIGSLATINKVSSRSGHD